MNPTVLDRVLNAVLGEDPYLRNRSMLCLMGAMVYTVWFLALTTFAIPQGRISPTVGMTLGALVLPGIFLFYPLIRSRWSEKFEDSGLVTPQIMYGFMVAIVGYAMAPTGRAALLQTLGLGLVFGFMTQNAQAATRTGIVLISMMMAMLAYGLIWTLPQFDPEAQTIKLVTAAFIMGIITLQSRRFALMRERVQNERRKLAALQVELERVTQYDALTGLLSRMYGQERLEQEYQRALLSQRSFGVILIDLDHFKQINDEHGHHVGDEVLITFAHSARQVLRDTDLIARWGGEEFLILLPDTSMTHEALHALDRLQGALRVTVVSKEAPKLRVSFSAGYALWKPGESVEHLLHRADEALYEAKRTGRQRAVAAT